MLTPSYTHEMPLGEVQYNPPAALGACSVPRQQSGRGSQNGFTTPAGVALKSMALPSPLLPVVAFLIIIIAAIVDPRLLHDLLDTLVVITPAWGSGLPLVCSAANAPVQMSSKFPAQLPSTTSAGTQCSTEPCPPGTASTCLLSAYSLAASELAGDAGLGSLSSDCGSSSRASTIARLAAVTTDCQTLRAWRKFLRAHLLCGLDAVCSISTSHRRSSHLDGRQHGGHVIDGAPLVLQDVQADAAVIIDCTTVYARKGLSRQAARTVNFLVTGVHSAMSNCVAQQGFVLTVGVEHRRHKLDHRRLVGIVLSKVHGELECACVHNMLIFSCKLVTDFH